ncbi:MAG: SDR family NAD(P)-dependent oxidoreductase [Myxococcota bacterium]
MLITGATAGIGFETAKTLAAQGHHLLVHGRSTAKVDALKHTLTAVEGVGPVEGWVADLADMAHVRAFAAAVTTHHDSLDVLINNAGVFKTPKPITSAGWDVRFVVNTCAPVVLTQKLRPLLDNKARVINLSSAAQSPVNLDALAGRVRLPDFEAYAQSKLALTMWSCHLGRQQSGQEPSFIAINPGSMLGTNMVREGFGVAGKKISIGSDILVRSALSDDFAEVSGTYFDNDAHRFAAPHPDALDPSKCEALLAKIGALIEQHPNTPN